MLRIQKLKARGIPQTKTTQRSIWHFLRAPLTPSNRRHGSSGCPAHPRLWTTGWSLWTAAPPPCENGSDVIDFICDSHTKDPGGTTLPSRQCVTFSNVPQLYSFKSLDSSGLQMQVKRRLTVSQIVWRSSFCPGWQKGFFQLPGPLLEFVHSCCSVIQTFAVMKSRGFHRNQRVLLGCSCTHSACQFA